MPAKQTAWTCDRDPSSPRGVTCNPGLPEVENPPAREAKCAAGADHREAAEKKAKEFFASREGLNFQEIGVIVTETESAPYKR